MSGVSWGSRLGDRVDSVIHLDSESLEGSKFGHPAFDMSVGQEGMHPGGSLS